MPISPNMAVQAAPMHLPLKLLTATTPQYRTYSIGRPASRLPDRHEDPARSLGADRTLDHLAGVRRLKLRALFAPLLAIRMVIIGDGLLRDLRRRGGGVSGCTVNRRAASCSQGVLEQCAPAKGARLCIHFAPSAQRNGRASALSRTTPCEPVYSKHPRSPRCVVSNME
jgi:hypothetical protein